MSKGGGKQWQTGSLPLLSPALNLEDRQAVTTFLTVPYYLLSPRTCPGCSVPEPYRSHDWALVPAKHGHQG